MKKFNNVLRVIEEEIILLGKELKSVTKHLSHSLKKGSKKHVIRNIAFACIALILFLAGAGLLWFTTIQIPDLSSFDKRLLGESTKIYDRTGTVLLYDLGQNVRRTVIPFDKISPNIKNATLAIEDASFYSHSGIKISSIIRAAFADIFSLQFDQGGSTITQQVVKNSLLTKDKTVTRKIKEILLSIKLEKTLSKDEIFNLYLNEAPYGGTIYGAEEASEAFFGKSASDLDLAESAYLAAIPQAPTYYSPYGSHKDALETRKNLVLQRMKENGFITGAQYDQAKAEKVTFQDQVTGGIKAPHFVMYIKDYLDETYGEQMVAQGGLKVITTLDYDLEQHAEEIVKKYALDNAKKYHATNSALVAVDAKTGGILTMVGSRDFFDKDIDGQFNVATAKRQPGSSFKPYVYAAAFNMGYRPETVLFDVPTQFSTNCSADNFTGDNGCYAPQDYDGKYRGPISLRNALAGSINIPAVKLLYLVGVQNAIDLATQMGISTLTTPDQYGLTLVLGGGEVTLLDMTGAYSVFANEGVKHQVHGIVSVTDNSGNILEQEDPNDQGTEVLPKDTALLISDVLSDNTARTPVFGAHSSLYFPDRDVAAKTGTTNDYRDTWVIGYTPQVAVGAWDGNNDNSPIAKQVAGYIVAPMWHEFMNYLLSTLPDERFEKPEQKDLSSLKPVLRGQWQGAVQGTDPLTGQPVVQNDVHSILYYVNKSDPLGPPPANPWSDPQFSHWEYSVSQWALQNGYVSGGATIVPGAGGTTGATNSTSMFVSFISPGADAIVDKDQKLSISIQTVSSNPIVKADYFLNGIYIGSNTNNPYDFSFIPSQMSAIGTSNTLRVIITDNKGSSKDASVNFTVK